MPSGGVASLDDTSGSDVSYDYQGVSTVVGQTFGNGVTETTALDQFGRTAEVKYVDVFFREIVPTISSMAMTETAMCCIRITWSIRP